MCKKTNKKIKDWFTKGIKNDETGAHLNYYTMEIKTPAIKQLLQIKLLENWNTFFWLALILMGAGMLVSILNFVNDST